MAEALTHLVAEVVPLPASIAAPAQEALARLTPEVMEPALFVLYARLRDAAFADDMPAFDAARSLFADWRFASVNTDPLPRLRVLAAGDDALSYDHQAKVG